MKQKKHNKKINNVCSEFFSLCFEESFPFILQTNERLIDTNSGPCSIRQYSNVLIWKLNDKLVITLFEQEWILTVLNIYLLCHGMRGFAFKDNSLGMTA